MTTPKSKSKKRKGAKKITVKAWALYAPRAKGFVMYNPHQGIKLAIEPPAIYLREEEADAALSASKAYSPHTDYCKIKVTLIYTPVA